ncbi:hypothetical protein, partial [Xanthobacter aminoxidans]|uniref:hypothetical protein n=1 Tax=Xanthobacter aminoxidans TaxID=186280 RepID=UPI00372C8427
MRVVQQAIGALARRQLRRHEQGVLRDGIEGACRPHETADLGEVRGDVAEMHIAGARIEKVPPPARRSGDEDVGGVAHA